MSRVLYRMFQGSPCVVYHVLGMFQGLCVLLGMFQECFLCVVWNVSRMFLVCFFRMFQGELAVSYAEHGWPGCQ